MVLELDASPRKKVRGGWIFPMGSKASIKRSTIICYQLTSYPFTCNQSHLLSTHLLSIHLQSVSFTINSLAIHSLAIRLICYQLSCYHFTNNNNVCSIHISFLYEIGIRVIITIMQYDIQFKSSFSHLFNKRTMLFTYKPKPTQSLPKNEEFQIFLADV